MGSPHSHQHKWRQDLHHSILMQVIVRASPPPFVIFTTSHTATARSQQSMMPPDWLVAEKIEWNRVSVVVLW
jgi:hypothetical protein